MRIDILTLFPEMFNILDESIIGRAKKNELIEINTINFRDYANNKHNQVDDYPYGGGNGMVIKPEPVYRAYMDIVKDLEYKPKTIYLSPKGKTLTNKIAKDISKEDHLILLCGHYEGIDQRVLDEIIDDEISIGDYVLTGGELPAMVLIDTVSRYIPGVLSQGSYEDESFENDLLEYPQYTRPEIFNDIKVPEVLLSGNHKEIAKWRLEKSIEITKKNRKDLFNKLFKN
ncbi:MAG: tRNA (guanosine(37)-N1)-methyltransferase TrmD [Clostridiales bacterium]|nr:tRNA (guanosine(37)-N1)-methyltransferase TrmD [Clostridiales bacterium]